MVKVNDVYTVKIEDMAEVLISDNGRGIPDVEKEKIFDKKSFCRNE